MVDLSWSPKGKKRQGRPPCPENRALSVKCEHPVTKQLYYRCIAEECDWFATGNPQRARVLKHATHCRKLSATLRHQANTWTAKSSLGSQVGELKPAATSPSAATSNGNPSLRKEKSTAPTQKTLWAKKAGAFGGGAPEAEPKVKETGGLGEMSVALGRKEFCGRVNHRIVKLICVRGLVPKTLDTLEWKAFVIEASNARYTPTSSTTFVDQHVPAEAAQVRLLQIQELQQRDNLTLTYDGGTTRRPQSVYTIHITTPDRRVYFIEGDEASRERHTAEHIKTLILEVTTPLRSRYLPLLTAF